MFLLIENKNVSPIEGFTILGLSSSRGKEDKLGQFGSGSKHGVLTLLRNNINPYIFLGEKELVFYTSPAKMGDHDYKEVHYIYEGTDHKLSYCLDFGKLDWGDVAMGLREFISNAIDNEEYSVDVTQEKEGREGYTRVYIPWSTEIQKYYNEIKWRFLHFQGKENLSFIEKDPGPCKIYRRGVYVRTIEGKNSLFDYNLNDLPIDECRNLDDHKARYHIGNAISGSEYALERIFKGFLNSEDFFEKSLSRYYMKASPYWESAWNKTCPKGVPCSSALHLDKIQRKGYIPVIMPDDFVTTLSNNNVKTQLDILTTVENKGAILLKQHPGTVKVLNKYWRILEKLDLINGKEKPEIRTFDKPIDGGERLLGYYDKGIIYVSIEEPLNEITVLEELVHHITGSTDMSRDFQEFLLKVATRMVNR